MKLVGDNYKPPAGHLDTRGLLNEYYELGLYAKPHKCLETCRWCRHLSKESLDQYYLGIVDLDDEGIAIYRCAAFPDGIPQSIFSKKYIHFDNVAGDEGIHYEPREMSTEEENID
jgi:hypothetical protein